MRDLLLLMRAPLAAGAASNVLVGAVLAIQLGAPTPPPLVLILLALGACCAYWAGMVWNDVFDLERDRELAPQRPLPSGRVSLGQARVLASILSALGLGLTTGAAALAGSWQAGALAAGAVATCVLAYDSALKRFRLPGALAMGACRGANALVGPAVLLGLAGLRPLTIAYATLLTVYVASLTWLSTWEDEDAPVWALLAGFGGVALATLGLAGALFAGAAGLSPIGGVPLVVFLPLTVLLARRALTDGTAARGRATTLILLKAVWLLDLAALIAVDADAPWFLGLFALWLSGRQGARALFAKPRS